MRWAGTWARGAVVVVLAGLHPPAQAQQSGGHDHATPERIARIVEALGIRAGSAVADVGAGGGDYTVKLAPVVGDSGRVHAVDVSADALTRLRGRLERERLTNVSVIEGAFDDPRLPPAAIDAALIVNAYHEMTEYKAMLARLREALRVGGRLVIIEPIADSARSQPREDQTRRHQIAPDLVLRDVRAAGFDVLTLEDPFRAGQAHADHGEWMLIATPGVLLKK